jgi:hypothetical protein
MPGCLVLGDNGLQFSNSSFYFWQRVRLTHGSYIVHVVFISCPENLDVDVIIGI